MPKPRPSESRHYFKEVRFRQLRAVVEVARRGNFSAAAASLRLSVPSVWQQVRALEKELGTELVIARGAQTSLTAGGELLVSLAAPLVEGFDSIRKIFSERLAELPRRITVATTATLLTYDLREPLQRFRKLHPGVELTFFDRPSRESRAILERGEADLAIVGELDDEPLPEIFDSTPLTVYPFMLVCPAGHPLAERRRITLAELARHPLVLPVEGTNSRRRIDARFGAAGLLDRLRVVLGAADLGMLTRYVTMGFGISMLSVSPVFIHEQAKAARDSGALVFREINSLFGDERVVLLRRSGSHEPPHAAALRQAIIEVFRKPVAAR